MYNISIWHLYSIWISVNNIPACLWDFAAFEIRKNILMKISYIIIIRLISLPKNFIIYNFFPTCTIYRLIKNQFDWICLLYTSDAADDGESVDLGGRRIIKKKKKKCFFFFSFFLSFFFFQAEDGIRDQPRSRGLGDVYKRQERKAQIQLRELESREDKRLSLIHI